MYFSFFMLYNYITMHGAKKQEHKTWEERYKLSDSEYNYFLL
jgi:hypothetical protein